MRAAYHHGVLLWEALQEITGWAERGGSMEHEGVRQLRKKANPQSPNFGRPVVVRTVVEERSETVAPGYETETALDNTLYAVEARLMAVADEKGPLVLCENDARVASVSGSVSPAAGATVSHGTPGGGWTPAAGDLVLFRRPDTNEGFTSTIQSVGSGTVVCTVTVALTTAWRMVRVERVYADAVFRGMSKSLRRGADDPGLDVAEVSYRFEVFGAVTSPSASVLAHGAT